MKRVTFRFALLALLFSCLTACGDYYIDPYGNAQEPMVVNFWTDGHQNLVVYIDGEKYGTISQSLTSEPDCGSAQCLVYYNAERGSRHTVYATTVDGSLRWESQTLKLNRNCQKVLFTQNKAGEAKLVVQ